MKWKLAASLFAILGIGCALGFLGALQAVESTGTPAFRRTIGFGLGVLLCGVGCLGSLVVGFSRDRSARRESREKDESGGDKGST